MSRVILVRHAQASFLEPNYDKLCATGESQARLLGEYWARRGVLFGRAWSGPRVRQEQTARFVEEAYRRLGREFPELVVMNEFDEYPAEAVMNQGLPQVLERSQEVRDLHRAFEVAKGSDDQKRSFQQMFEAVIGMWVSGELVVEDVESWQDFCARVDRGITTIVDGATSPGDSVVFTSGGPIGVAMRRALHLSHADTLQLTWMSRNASFTEFLSSGSRFTLSTFNAHPHLEDESLLTYR
ncbi:MAG TPA: histidine phosphatase family protein [Candidatus Binatus sp.]|jgi:broad specificity phosphatase PhoE|nr:histidine phosphatase family protein [Candidatus Binatus sp.]